MINVFNYKRFLFKLVIFGISITCLPCAALVIPENTVSLSERLDILIDSYQPFIKKITTEGKVLMSDGSDILIDDGLTKAHDQKLNHADIKDMLEQIYPLGNCFNSPPSKNFEPGRIRNEVFFKAIYGKTRKEVSHHLTSIDWFGEKLPITTVLAVDKALLGVAHELAMLRADLYDYFTETGGTFNWRYIAGTKLLSMHSFATALDINTKHSDYWRDEKSNWYGPGNEAPLKYKNRIPIEIVNIFEHHGFIWGGKWYHYDTMHFEYRPELIKIGQLAATRNCGKR